MLNLKREIRYAVGPYGMIVYTPDKSQACIAYDVDGSNYILKNEPAILWKGREELFYLRNFEEYTPKEGIFLFIRMLLSMFAVSIFQTILKKYTTLSLQNVAGLSYLGYALIYLFEFSIMVGFKRRKSERGRRLMRLKGALNKAINAFEKKQAPPTIEEIKKASLYKSERDHHMKPNEIAGLVLIGVAIFMFIPTTKLQIILLPMVIIIEMVLYKTSIFGLLRVTQVLEPTEYEIIIATSLIEFWYEISYKNAMTAK